MSLSPPSALLQHQAPAKINLGLHVLRRRPDGFHDVETVLLPIAWEDTLHVESATTFRFTCSDASLPTDERNLCVRAALQLSKRAGVEPSGWLHLEKQVPHGAGLGGGSSDAAHTLRLLTQVWGLSLEAGTLHTIAADLGSDVPFFLHNEPMLATGRGERLEPLAEDPYHLPYALAVVMPPVQISTAAAYALVQPHDRGRPNLRDVVTSNDLARWRRELVNDFEAPVLKRYPQIHRARQRLVEAGAGYAALSGSGAAVYGVFERGEDARRAAEEARRQGMTAWYNPSVEGTPANSQSAP